MLEGKISAAMELESTTLRISYPGARILPEVEQVPGVYRLVINICTPTPLLVTFQFTAGDTTDWVLLVTFQFTSGDTTDWVLLVTFQFTAGDTTDWALLVTFQFTAGDTTDWALLVTFQFTAGDTILTGFSR